MLKPIPRRRRHIKKRRRLARDKNVDLWSLDECHFQQHGSRCAMWVPPEDKDPIVLHAPTRKSMGLFGAVNLRTGKLVTMMISQFDGATFEAFLRMLLRHRKRSGRTVVILDNARYHHAAVLQPFLRERARRGFRLDFLPPYSPELNPIERVWKLLRRLCIHNQYFAELQELVQVVENRLAIWSKPNVTLARLCGIT